MQRGLARHGLAVRSALTCNGRLEVRRLRYEKIDGSTDASVDELIDLAGCGVSLAVREMCCRIATDSGSFVRAAWNLERLAYLIQRKEKVNYASFRAAGYDVGSGPTESMCKSLSRRMKGIGMRWKAQNAESLVALEALHQSNLWLRYWSTRLAA